MDGFLKKNASRQNHEEKEQEQEEDWEED